MSKTVHFICGVLAAAAIASSVFFLTRTESDKRYQSTDDAYIKADSVTISPQVSGRIVEVTVKENQEVKKGDLLAIIDERSYAVQAASMRAALQSAIAARDSTREHVTRQGSEISQAKATMDANKAALSLAEQELARYRKLATDGSGSRQALDQAATQFKIAQANFQRDEAKYLGEQQQLNVLQADLKKAEALIVQSQADLEAAELNLSYCRLYAPADGVIGQYSIRQGSYANIGQALMAIIPLQQIYIEAFFRENQLTHIRPGQPVEISIDAFPEQRFTGVIETLAPASNASFSALAPHSTSSNFTKIAQRLAVRISIEHNNQAEALLRVGMSAHPRVDTQQ